VWGKDLLEGDKGLDPAQSALLFVTFFLLVYVGTLAAQVTASQPPSQPPHACLYVFVCVCMYVGCRADDGGSDLHKPHYHYHDG